MVNFAGEWRWEMFQQYLPASTLLRIASITVMTRGNYCDSVGWNATTDKSFSVSSAYRFRCTQGVRAVLLEVDSEDVVRVVRSCRGGGSIFNKVLELMDREWNVEISWIPRRINRVADGLARLAKLDSLECEFFAAPPDELIDLVQTDMSEAALG
ncbi:hypothetical protein V6N11_062621 [Hibiscus sabdariffa]|uniref:RNase H type-1 domain-containing protein n=1 Tax=Hibiscus sabdariffa TaxID=183260 RepID=A0ABR2PT34_9ROSI